MPIKRRVFKSQDIQSVLLDLNTPTVSLINFMRIFKLTKNQAQRFIREAIDLKILVRLKRGIYYLYVKPPTSFQIANSLVAPSYISLDTALSYYRIIPENVYSTTSITPKHTKKFYRMNGEYTYSQINKKLFFGYRKVNIAHKRIVIAEPEKAFLDYIYFVVRGLRKMNDRFDFSQVNKNKLIVLLPYFRKELKGVKLKAFNNLINNILKQKI